MNIHTGVQMEKVLTAASFIEQKLGKPLTSKQMEIQRHKEDET